MATNDEIKKKYNIKKQKELLTLKDLEKIIGTEGFNGLVNDWNNQISLFLDDLDKMLNEARADGYKEGHNDHKSDCLEYEKARADTTKQIFAELDKMIEELDNSLRTIGEITLDAEKYEALKKKHEVPR